MSEPFIGEIRMFGFNFAPRSWSFCDGQLLPINQNSALFSLLGTTYGGDGRTTFGLPDLRGRFPLHSGNGSAGPGLTARNLGSKSGLQDTTLPAHTHSVPVSANIGNETSPVGNVPAVANDGESNYSDTSTANSSTAVTGNSPVDTNMPPYLAINFCIALTGLFPSRS